MPYRKAFDRSALRALWNVRRLEDLTMTRGLAVGEASRTEGNLATRALTVRLEAAR